MRPSRRVSTAKRTRTVPARSRVTVQRPSANLVRRARLLEALRTSRQALTDLQGQLDALLAQVRDPSGVPEAASLDRLRAAAARAGSAVTSMALE